MWGADLTHDLVEDDDELHRPEKNIHLLDQSGGMFSGRGLANLGCVAVLVLGLIALL
jgi:beta-glucan synthesis-associated protein KRE6